MRLFALASAALFAAGGATFAQSTGLTTYQGPPVVPSGHGTPHTPSDVVVTQSASQAITPGNSVSCNNGIGHTDNWYFRVFDISGLGADLEVQSLEVGVELASSPSGTQPVRFRVYDSGNLNDTITNTNIVHESTVAVPNQSGTILSVPVSGTLSSGSMIVEVFTPDGQATSTLFFIGSNSAGQSGPSYLRADACGVTTPTPTGAIGFPNMHIVMNVNGKLADTEPGTNFCTSVANSTGFPAVMSGTGSSTVADNDLTVSAGPVPNTAYIFFYGTTQIQVPFGNGGFQCAGGSIQRLNPPAFASGNVATRTVLPGATIVPPVTLHFQCWFRDPSVGPDGFNTSDGYTVNFN